MVKAAYHGHVIFVIQTSFQFQLNIHSVSKVSKNSTILSSFLISNLRFQILAISKIFSLAVIKCKEVKSSKEILADGDKRKLKLLQTSKEEHSSLAESTCFWMSSSFSSNPLTVSLSRLRSEAKASYDACTHRSRRRQAKRMERARRCG